MRPRWRDPGRLADVAYLAIAGSFVALRLFSVEPWDQSVDAFAYWKPVEGGSPYDDAAVGSLGAYLYSPAFKLLFVPLGWLPWPIFNAGWTALNFLVLRAVAGRLALPLLLFPPVPFEIISGNVHLLLAGVAAWGLARPVPWMIPFLTKVTPGIGVLFLLVRREWRASAVALGSTAAVALASWLLVPAWWADWLAVLQGGQSVPLDAPGWYLPVALWLRLPLAAVVVAWGGRTGRPWTIPVGMVLALPVAWLNGLAILVALVPLLEPERHPGRATTPRPAARAT